MMFFFNSYAEFYTEQHILYSSCVSLAIIPVTSYNKLGPYLAGLIEGDGTIIIPKTNKTLKGTNNYGYIQICFALKDLPLARYFLRRPKPRWLYYYKTNFLYFYF